VEEEEEEEEEDLTQLFSNTAKALYMASCSMKVVIHPGLTVNFPDCKTGKRTSIFWVRPI
jgi:hypothetical protein